MEQAPWPALNLFTRTCEICPGLFPGSSSLPRSIGLCSWRVIEVATSRAACRLRPCCGCSSHADQGFGAEVFSIAAEALSLLKAAVGCSNIRPVKLPLTTTSILSVGYYCEARHRNYREPTKMVLVVEGKPEQQVCTRMMRPKDRPR